MTTKWPSAISSLSRHHNASIRMSSRIRFDIVTIRPYSTPPSNNNNNNNNKPPSPQVTNDDLNRPEKAALVEITGLRKIDPVNAPRSTLPPPLRLPERGDQNVAVYYYRIGRAYGSFYFSGVKAVWFNHQACKALRERVKKELEREKERGKDGGGGGKKRSSELDFLTRSEFQLLVRNRHDISKLPFFGLLVAIFGEWLPLLVPFIPSVVPGTCRIPKQVAGMRAKAQERRRVSFRRGISEPSREQIREVKVEEGNREEWAMTRREVAGETLLKLRDDQLFHLSCNLNNHNSLWDRLQLPPPSILLRRGLAKKLSYITSDDKLLGMADRAAQRLTPDELAIACEERGIDVLGKREETLRKELAEWLTRQKEDEGAAETLMVLLFRRPNAWSTKV